MRQHRRFAQLAPMVDLGFFHEVVRAEYLLAARMEPGYSVRNDNFGLLDLTFARDGRIAVVPYLLVQGVQLFNPQESPFLWPAWLPTLRREVVREIEERVEPSLRARAIARFVNGEVIERFGDDPAAAALFDRARARGFAGAAPADRVMESLAPYAYALRFFEKPRVAVRSAGGANGAALLARYGSVDADLGDASLVADAAAWFGPVPFVRAADGAAFDVAIGERALLPQAKVRIAIGGADSGVAGERHVAASKPVPIFLMMSYDPADSAPGTAFGVAADPAAISRSTSVRPATIVGGSAGRIGIVVRDDCRTSPDADTDAADALAERLAEQGFTPSVVGASHVAADRFDLLHVVGYACADALETALARQTRRLPTVVAPYLDDRNNEAAWGTSVHLSALMNAFDESTRGMYAQGLVNRALNAADTTPLGTSLISDAARRLLRRAGAAIVANESEEERLRAEFGFSGLTRCVPALLAAEPEPDGGVGSLAPRGDFVLSHAPMDPRCGQHLLATACALAGYPLVLTGPVRDTNYYLEVLSALGPQGVWIPADALSTGELAALYRTARVFADVSWNAAGLYRVARAAACGAAIVAPRSGFAREAFPGSAHVVDSGSAQSVGEGLRTAWQQAEHLGKAAAAEVASRMGPFESLKAVLGAYQHAAAASAV